MSVYNLQGKIWRLYDSGRVYCAGQLVDAKKLAEALHAERLANMCGGVA